jgi:cold shock CspA family protein
VADRRWRRHGHNPWIAACIIDHIAAECRGYPKELRMLCGVVDRVDSDGKFGFIIGPNGEEYFFHQTALMETEFGDLGPGVPVEFNSDEDNPGDLPDEHIRAINVRLADDAVPAVENEPLPPEKVVGPAG